jgi:hypothetical protein
VQPLSLMQATNGLGLTILLTSDTQRKLRAKNLVVRPLQPGSLVSSTKHVRCKVHLLRYETRLVDL